VSRISVEAARESQVCRVCRQPLANPSPQSGLWLDDNGPARPYEAGQFGDGAEFAHVACLVTHGGTGTGTPPGA
jgi:hypothetical protein